MDLKNVRNVRTSLTFLARSRLLVWTLFSRRRSGTAVIDPRYLSDQRLQDLGLERPSQSWDESVGFWRDP
jgi:hypothetical protein